jgi:hypothetical protein
MGKEASPEKGRSGDPTEITPAAFSRGDDPDCARRDPEGQRPGHQPGFHGAMSGAIGGRWSLRP